MTTTPATTLPQTAVITTDVTDAAAAPVSSALTVVPATTVVVPKMTAEQVKEYFALSKKAGSTTVQNQGTSVKPASGNDKIVCIPGVLFNSKDTKAPSRGTVGNKAAGKSVGINFAVLRGNPFYKEVDGVSVIFLPLVPTTNSEVTTDATGRFMKGGSVKVTPTTCTPLSRVDGCPIQYIAIPAMRSAFFLGPAPSVADGSPCQVVGAYAKYSQSPCDPNQPNRGLVIDAIAAANMVHPVRMDQPWSHNSLEDLIANWRPSRFFGYGRLTIEMFQKYMDDMEPAERLSFEYEYPSVTYNSGKSIGGMTFDAILSYTEIRQLSSGTNPFKARDDFQASIYAKRDEYDREVLKFVAIRQEIQRTRAFPQFDPISITLISSTIEEGKRIEEERMMNGLLDDSTTPGSAKWNAIPPVGHFTFYTGQGYSTCFSSKNEKAAQLISKFTALYRIPKEGLTYIEAEKTGQIYDIAFECVAYEPVFQRSDLAWCMQSKKKEDQPKEIEEWDRLLMHLLANTQVAFGGVVTAKKTYALSSATIIDPVPGTAIPFAMDVVEFHPDLWSYLSKFGIPTTPEAAGLLLNTSMPTARDLLSANVNNIGSVTNLTKSPKRFMDCVAAGCIFNIMIVPPPGAPSKTSFTSQFIQQITPETGAKIFARGENTWNQIEADGAVDCESTKYNEDRSATVKFVFTPKDPMRVATAAFSACTYVIFARRPKLMGSPEDALIVNKIVQNGACYMDNGMLILGVDASSMPPKPAAAQPMLCITAGDPKTKPAPATGDEDADGTTDPIVDGTRPDEDEEEIAAIVTDPVTVPPPPPPTAPAPLPPVIIVAPKVVTSAPAHADKDNAAPRPPVIDPIPAKKAKPAASTHHHHTK